MGTLFEEVHAKKVHFLHALPVAELKRAEFSSTTRTNYIVSLITLLTHTEYQLIPKSFKYFLVYRDKKRQKLVIISLGVRGKNFYFQLSMEISGFRRD